ncbi:MAG: hypothetical protein K2L51_01110 [Clostridiales bacterium]|nr:hypothetical protein [Clostridiales bacterium]
MTDKNERETKSATENESFRYAYSAPTEEERKEIIGIRNSYTAAPKEVSPLEQLRALDARVRRFALILALALGIGGSLLFGTGFALFSEWGRRALGVVVGCIGIACMALAYPAHRIALKKQQAKYAAEIERLSKLALGEPL